MAVHLQSLGVVLGCFLPRGQGKERKDKADKEHSRNHMVPASPCIPPLVPVSCPQDCFGAQQKHIFCCRILSDLGKEVLHLFMLQNTTVTV